MMWIIAIAAVCLLFGMFLVCIAPLRSSAQQRAPFERRSFAHRGLYRRDQQIPENSIAAFLAAVEAGYGVELDVQLTSDGQVIVFHDTTLLRACNLDAKVDEIPYARMQSDMRLFGTIHTIPLFSDVLAAIGGRIPIIVELKGGNNWKALCKKTLSILLSYQGDYCIESFDPRIVRWFYRHAPNILRGQLSEQYCHASKTAACLPAFFMSHLFCNFWSHPQFIAYRIGPRPRSVQLAMRMGAMRIAWTANAADSYPVLMQQNDAIIFEHDQPPIRW